jgi:hypothetical protein
VPGARDLVCALRSLLRYLHLAGLIEGPLVWAVPPVADLRDRTLPRGLDPGAVSKLLASCDRRTLGGRRDYAILLLLARLGLRAGEVAGLQLDDVDWRRGELLIRGKGGRQDVLPLPVDAGEALVSYLRRRPRCQCRAVFLRVTAPRRELNRSTIGWVVRAACDRAGLPRAGAHRLRHTAATQAKGRGVALNATFRVRPEDGVAGPAALPGVRRACGPAAGHAADQGFLAPGCGGCQDVASESVALGDRWLHLTLRVEGAVWGQCGGRWRWWLPMARCRFRPVPGCRPNSSSEPRALL